MNLILIEQPLEQVQFSAGDPRFEHARGVLRIRKEDTFYVGVANGPLGLATVTHVNTEHLRASIVWESSPRRQPYPIELFIGLSRPQTMKKVLFEAACWGIQSVQVVPSGKSDPAYARSSFWQDGAFNHCIREGMEQGFHTCQPLVKLHKDWPSLIKYYNDNRVAESNYAYALDIHECDGCFGPTVREQWAPGGSLRLALGPERGWNAPDRAQLRALGFRAVSLGQTVLRVESAVSATLALAVDALTGPTPTNPT